MSEDRRLGPRFRFHFNIQYERILEDGSLALPVTVSACDICMNGFSFYTEERMKLYSKLRIKIRLSRGYEVFFMAKVIRMEVVDYSSYKYLIGVVIEDISPEFQDKIQSFLEEININKFLAKLDLTDVVDIHFIVNTPPLLKKIGRLSTVGDQPLSEEATKGLLLNMLDSQRYEKFIKEKELNFIFPYKDHIRFRVNLHIQQGKIEGVMRLIPPIIRLPRQLGLPPIVEKLLEYERGFILVAGRTGSGKSTTLASMIEVLNNRRRGVVVSIEDPIEYIHTNKKCFIKKREVGKDTLSFSSAAKNALRQNPDVLVIGEILDMESMEVVITAAETGMFVFSSIHASNCSQALDRVTSFFPADLQRHILARLALTLKGVITQDLIPTVDQSRLLVATEVLVVNDAARRIIRTGEWQNIPTLLQLGRKDGMHTMLHCLEDYYKRGLIDESYMKAYAESYKIGYE